MFEAYGWANVGTLEDLAGLKAEIAKAEIGGWADFHLTQRLNWAGAALTCAVCRNHRYDPVFDVFRWIATHGPSCYGVFFVRDQESEHENEYRVWRLARGELREFADPFLSPCIPTIELPFAPDSEA